jgi:hypothetical protein
MKRIIYSLVSTITLYLVIAFIAWDILIILSIGEIDGFLRFIILLLFIFKEAITQMIYEEFND